MTGTGNRINMRPCHDAWQVSIPVQSAMKIGCAILVEVQPRSLDSFLEPVSGLHVTVTEGGSVNAHVFRTANPGQIVYVRFQPFKIDT